VTSLAASANVPGFLGRQPPRPAASVVREFRVDLEPAPAHSLGVVRGFALPATKEDWDPEDEVAEDILFENELHPTGPEGVRLVTRIDEGQAPAEGEAEVAAEEPMGSFFLDRYIPLAGDTLRTAARRLGCRPELLDLLNPDLGLDAPLDATRSIEIYRGRVTAHEVSRGDTLWSVARRYGLSTRRLKRLNPSHVQVLRVGRWLRLRSRSRCG